jgi:outer membrane lipoprotein-sorting protein
MFVAAVVAALAGGTALAFAAMGGSGPTPPPKPLAQAVHDAITAPPVPGVTARIRFTNNLIEGASLANGQSPVLSGATGRLWASADGRLRLELQSGRGDAQVLSDGKTITFFDASSNSAYRVTLPRRTDRAAKSGTSEHQPPSVAKIEEFLKDLAGEVDVSGAIPSDVAGRPAYTVRISPKHDGGLIGAAELAFDAQYGTPLRAAVYASGKPDPVLELKATDIRFGPVDASALDGSLPPGAKVKTIDLGRYSRRAADKRDAGGPHAPDVTGPQAVGAQVPFKLSAPDQLAGLPRREVRLIDIDDEKGALVTYGAGLGGIAVLEHQATSPDASRGPRDEHRFALPRVTIDGAPGEELATALGTIVRFQRDGVHYTVVGSVPPAAAEAAARDL